MICSTCECIDYNVPAMLFFHYQSIDHSSVMQTVSSLVISFNGKRFQDYTVCTWFGGMGEVILRTASMTRIKDMVYTCIMDEIQLVCRDGSTGLF